MTLLLTALVIMQNPQTCCLPEADGRPVVTQLSDDLRQPLREYGEKESIREGYVISSPLLLPSGRWVVAYLDHVRQEWPQGGEAFPRGTSNGTAGQVTQVGLLAIAMESGEARLLRLPGANARLSPSIGQVFALHDNACGIPVTCSTTGDAAGNQRQVLWRWNLADNTLCNLGKWLPVTRLANALDFRECCLCWSAAGEWNGNVQVRNRSTGNAVNVRLDTSHFNAAPRYLWESPANWFGPAEGPGAFVSTNVAENKSDIFIRCFDPNAATGVRWSIEHDRLQAVLGGAPRQLVPIVSQLHSRRTLPILVELASSPEVEGIAVVFILIVNTRTGDIVKSIPIPEIDAMPVSMPVISPDGHLMIYETFSGDNPSFGLLDIEGETVVSEFADAAEAGHVDAFAITEDKHLLASDGASISAYNLNQGHRWQRRPVFTLERSTDTSR